MPGRRCLCTRISLRHPIHLSERERGRARPAAPGATGPACRCDARPSPARPGGSTRLPAALDALRPPSPPSHTYTSLSVSLREGYRCRTAPIAAGGITCAGPARPGPTLPAARPAARHALLASLSQPRPNTMYLSTRVREIEPVQPRQACAGEKLPRHFPALPYLASQARRPTGLAGPAAYFLQAESHLCLSHIPETERGGGAAQQRQACKRHVHPCCCDARPGPARAGALAPLTTCDMPNISASISTC